MYEIEAHSSFEIKQFSTEIGEIEAQSSFESWQFSTDIGEIEAQSNHDLKMCHFRRNLVNRGAPLI